MKFDRSISQLPPKLYMLPKPVPEKVSFFNRNLITPSLSLTLSSHDSFVERGRSNRNVKSSSIEKKKKRNQTPIKDGRALEREKEKNLTRHSGSCPGGDARVYVCQRGAEAAAAAAAAAYRVNLFTSLVVSLVLSGFVLLLPRRLYCFTFTKRSGERRSARGGRKRESETENEAPL